MYSLELSWWEDSNEYTQHNIVFIEDRKGISKSSPFAIWTCAKINPQWFELHVPMFRTNFHGPKDVRAIEVRLYVVGTH